MMKSNFFYDLDKIIKKKIISYSENISPSKIKILVTYSGGVDSSVLLHVVDGLSKELGFKYDFVYVNHRMNPNDKHILMYADKFFNNHNCNFIYKEIIQTPRNNKETIENFIIKKILLLLQVKKWFVV